MKQLRQFLGMVNFYRRFIPNCAKILRPLTDILTNIKNCNISLSTEALEAFNNIQRKNYAMPQVCHMFQVALSCV